MSDHCKPIERLLFEAATVPSDINEHVMVLYALASRCNRVVEYGVRSGVSTTALIAGLCQSNRIGNGRTYYTGYDINPGCSQVVDAIAHKAAGGGCMSSFFAADTRLIQPPPCDMLFIDTLHTGEQLSIELERSYGSVIKYIVLHDTVTFGVHGETPGSEGLGPALTRFLDKHGRQRFRTAFLPNNNGLTILERI